MLVLREDGKGCGIEVREKRDIMLGVLMCFGADAETGRMSSGIREWSK